MQNTVSLGLPFHDCTIVWGAAEAELYQHWKNTQRAIWVTSHLSPRLKGGSSGVLLRGAEELDHQLLVLTGGDAIAFCPPPVSFVFFLFCFSVLAVCWFNSMNLSKLLQDRSQSGFLPDAELVCWRIWEILKPVKWGRGHLRTEGTWNWSGPGRREAGVDGKWNLLSIGASYWVSFKK